MENLKYNTNLDGPGAGAAVDVKLTSDDFDALAAASDELANMLRGYPSLISIENTFSAGKQQLDYQILPEGRSLGLTSSDVARQLVIVLWFRSLARAGGSIGASNDGSTTQVRAYSRK